MNTSEGLVEYGTSAFGAFVTCHEPKSLAFVCDRDWCLDPKFDVLDSKRNVSENEHDN